MNAPVTPTSVQAASMSLTEAAPGQRVRICDVDAGRGLRARLCALGLTQGMSVEVVAVTAGPVILRVLGSRLVVGHGMASRVRVRPAGAHAA